MPGVPAGGAAAGGRAAGSGAAKKTAAKKAPAKKAPAKRAPAKKAAAPAAKKTAARKPPAKKAAAAPPEQTPAAPDETAPAAPEEETEETPEETEPGRDYLGDAMGHDVTQTGAGIILGILGYAVLVNYLRGGLPQVKEWFQAKFLNVDRAPNDFTSIPGVHEIPGQGLGSAVGSAPLKGGSKK